VEEQLRAPYFDGSQPCAEIGGDMWFPDEYGDMKGFTPELRKICNSCPFIKPCFEYAVTHDVDGLWAATTGIDRKNYRKKYGIKIIPYAFSGKVLPENL